MQPKRDAKAELNRRGQALYDEAANQAFAQAMAETLVSEVELIELDAHINDVSFAAAVVETFLRLRGTQVRP